jgi:XTP/dITP diphosphohydrolase
MHAHSGEGTSASAQRGRPAVVFLATRNPGKVAELQERLEGRRIRVIGPESIAELGAPVEDGATFHANARKKALHYSRLVKTLVLSDDSGLEVDALGGEPGVRSARLGGPSATDDDRVKLILRRLESVPWEKRGARFRCVLAVAAHGEILATFDGSVEGRIAFEPAGGAGFGYDPIFYYPPMDRTFAEMTRAEKDRVSHRGQALDRAVGWLIERLAPAQTGPPHEATAKRRAWGLKGNER